MSKKKQHWVPYFYLKNWATDDSKDKKEQHGWILSKNDGEPIKVNLRDFAAKEYLYSPPDNKGERNFATEDKLSVFESVMSSFWSEISDEFYDFSNGTYIRKGLALFISLLYLRNPVNINLIKDVHNQIVDMYDKFPKDRKGNPLLTKFIYKEKEHKVNTSDYKKLKNASDIDFQNMFIESIDREAIPVAEILMKKRWAIVFSDNENFITSDKPVVLENYERINFGLNTKGTTITFPISPKRMLVMDDLHEEGDGKFYPLKDDNPVPFNFIIWRNAREFMLSKRHPDMVCGEIVKDAEGFLSQI